MGTGLAGNQSRVWAIAQPRQAGAGARAEFRGLGITILDLFWELFYSPARLPPGKGARNYNGTIRLSKPGKAPRGQGNKAIARAYHLQIAPLPQLSPTLPLTRPPALSPNLASLCPGSAYPNP